MDTESLVIAKGQEIKGRLEKGKKGINCDGNRIDMRW